MIFGLTGQSGAGKSTVSRLLKQEEGFAVIDCDNVAKQVTADGSLCNIEIKKVFPEAVSEDLVLDRGKMAQIVFSDIDRLRQYEGIIYPFITAQVMELVSLYSSYGYQAIILDAPTLFEAGIDSICDKIISVIAKKNVRADRIRARDGISDEMIQKRFSSQRDDEFFKSRSDIIIENNDSVYELEDQTRKLIKTIRTMING